MGSMKDTPLPSFPASFANTSTQFDGNTQTSRIYTDEYRQEAQEKLTKRLAPECISQRPGGGNSSAYLLVSLPS